MCWLVFFYSPPKPATNINRTMAKKRRLNLFQRLVRGNQKPQATPKAAPQSQSQPQPVLPPSPVESSKPEKGKNAPKLTAEQREQLLEWLASGYSPDALRALMIRAGIPSLDSSTLSYYRTTYGTRIDELRKIRYSEALSTGLATREERVERLKKHADELDEIKWVPDKNGRLWNEKAWRETLDQIAEECGDKETLADKISELTIQFRKKEPGDGKK
jgi:hypothetical protein